jgi:Tol biopolymer transport system component
MRSVIVIVISLVMVACGVTPSPPPSVERYRSAPTTQSVPSPTAPPRTAPSATTTPGPGAVAATAGESASSTTLSRAELRGRITFSAETSEGIEDVFTLDLGNPGASRERVTDGTARAFDPDLSPDGNRIVYRVNPDPRSDAADLWLIARDGSDSINLTRDASLDNWSPAWSPDGSRIAFATTRQGGTLSVWTMAADGSDARRVTTGHGEYPDWSPDGTRIVYAAPASASGGSYDLWITDISGPATPTRLTSAPTTEFAPAWSADGEWIAYQLDTGTRWELWIIRPDGSDARRFSPAGEDGVWPAWGPSGLLAWSGPRGLSFGDPAGAGGLSIAVEPPGSEFLSWGP